MLYYMRGGQIFWEKPNRHAPIILEGAVIVNININMNNLQLGNQIAAHTCATNQPTDLYYSSASESHLTETNTPVLH